MSWGNVFKQLPLLSFRKITYPAHTNSFFSSIAVISKECQAINIYAQMGSWSAFRSSARASIVRFLKWALIQNLQVYEDLSEHPANRSCFTEMRFSTNKGCSNHSRKPHSKCRCFITYFSFEFLTDPARSLHFIRTGLYVLGQKVSAAQFLDVFAVVSKPFRNQICFSSLCKLFFIYFFPKKNNLLMWCWNHIIYVIERAWAEMSGLIIVSGSILCMKSVFINRPDLSPN